MIKRDKFEFLATLFLFFLSLIYLLIINIIPNDDEIFMALIIFQSLGVVLTLSSGIFGRGK